jgi:amidohydrolase
VKAHAGDQAATAAGNGRPSGVAACRAAENAALETALVAALPAELPPAIELRHELHRWPELSGHEDRTADRVVTAVASATEPRSATELQWALTDPASGPAIRVSSVAGTGRLLRIGPATGPAVAIRAELDALPVTELTGAGWASEVPGAMHACGHDVHLAAAVALARSAAAAHREHRLPAALVLILQPREELAPSGARDVVDSGLLIQQDVRAVVGVHLQPQVAAGRLAVDPGVVNAGVDEFTITITGRGGHSAYPHLALDPVPALCQSVLAVREATSVVDPMRPSVITVGMLDAGSAPNVIGEVATAHGTTRTFDPADRDRVHARMRAAVTATATGFGCTGELTIARGEPALHNDPVLVAAVRARLGPARLAAEFRSCGSDDFAAYGEVLPSVMMFLGVADDSPMLHDARFLPPDRLIGETAAALLAGYLGAVDLLP